MHLSTLLVPAILTVAASAQTQRDADAILAEISSLEGPAFDPARGQDPAYVDEYQAAMDRVGRNRSELILELYELHPKHDEIPGLMSKRWSWLATVKEFDTIHVETEAILEREQRSPLAIEAAHAAAAALGSKHKYRADPFLPAVERFAAAAPDDSRAAELFMRAAQYGTEDHALRRRLYERILSRYPNAFAARSIPGKLRQLDGIGKPFELEFEEVRSGEKIAMASLRGKVVVIDFWATWCGPCVGAMPHLKELYAKYRDRGVEFIGVSLDKSVERGGRDRLLAFCEEHGITWPQYYQGNKYDSEFSRSWGINSIPVVFVVDREGNLHSVDARYKLDEMIPRLLRSPSSSALPCSDHGIRTQEATHGLRELRGLSGQAADPGTCTGRAGSPEVR